MPGKVKTFIRAHAPEPLYVAAAHAKASVMNAIWPMTYQEAQVARAGRECRIRGARVLVVGASTGRDCGLFIERGASEVHGIDIRADVGSEFQHPRVIYHRTNVERTTLPARYFDLTFAVATFEHVHDIGSGFVEMARLTRSGGTIYSFAAPLWQSRYGHHMAGFDEHPWVHLAFDKEQLLAYGRSRSLPEFPSDDTLDTAVTYMFGEDNFNRRAGRDYIATCDNIPGIKIRANSLFREPGHLLHHPLAKIALDRGFDADDMLSTGHTLIATAI